MPDPIDELENFSIPGPPMNPLPATEVRRRGDRIRRRNNALATVGALAVVAAIATPFAVAAGGNDDSIQPAGTVDWVTTIPADIDLTAGMSGDGAATSSEDPVVGENVCGVAWYFVPQPTDQLSSSTENAGSEGGHDRHLAVFADADEAEAAMKQFGQAPTNCDGIGNDPVGNDGVFDDEGLRYRMYAASATATTAEDASAWVQALHDGTSLTSEGYLTVAQRVGNAVLVDRAISMGVGDENVRQDGVRNLLARDEDVVDQLCVFAAEGCAPDEQPSEAVDDPAGLSGPIADDFPLEVGLPTDQSGGAVGLEGPSHDLDLAVYNVENSLQACGVGPSGLPEPVDTLYAGYRSPAEGILRQVMTFGSAEDAQAYADGVLAPFAACPEDTDDRGVSKVYEVVPGDLGDSSSASVMRTEVDGEPGPGYQVVQVVRVGQAVLLSLVNNDGEELGPDGATSYLENVQTVVDAMR